MPKISRFHHPSKNIQNVAKHRVQKSDAGVGIGTLVGANAPTPPYGGGLAPPTPPLMVGASAPTPPLSRPVGLPNG